MQTAQALSVEEQRILQLSGGVRTSPRFDWTQDEGDSGCWVCGKPVSKGRFNAYFCCDKHRKAALAWNKKHDGVTDVNAVVTGEA